MTVIKMILNESIMSDHYKHSSLNRLIATANDASQFLRQ